jgi:eukaryotic-like serine/threonine-protein kinase
MSRGSAKDQRQSQAVSDDAADSFDLLLREVAHLSAPPVGARLPAPGQVIGDKYRIEGLLGRGGMGAVFHATHLVTDKPVALKVMLQPASDARVRRRFLREARAAGRIAHPNVVDVYDVGQDGDFGYLVMELLRGETLGARLSRGKLDVREAIDLLAPAMRGVAAVHRAGVVHRDLKPENIFLCQDTEGAVREAKVLDLGISAIVAFDVNDPTLTQDGAQLGTPAYMSPEQLQSSREVDARTDVYAFGVILYEMLTGVLPFSADSYNGLVLAIVNAEPRNPSELRADLPSELGAIVMHALAKRRDERFESVDDLLEALRPYGSASAADARRDVPVAFRTRLAPTRRRWLWAAAGVLLVCSLAYVWLGRVARGATATPKPVAAEHVAAPPAKAIAAVLVEPLADPPALSPQAPSAPARAEPAKRRPRNAGPPSAAAVSPRTSSDGPKSRSGSILPEQM